MGNAAEPARHANARRAAAAAPHRAHAGGAGALTGLQRALGNAGMARLLRSPRGPAVLRGGPRVLARDDDVDVASLHEIHTATAERELGPNDRPSSTRFWNAYRTVSYAVYHGEEMRDDVWKFVGGSIGSDFVGGNTCATRVSWAFNQIGWPVRPIKTPAKMFKAKFFYNSPKVTFAGKAGDGRWYLVGAPDMETYLRLLWGKPDVRCTSNQQVKDFEATLAGGQIAIFAGPHHSGAIMGQDPDWGWNYSDAYAKTDPGVMPISAWTLPTS